MIKRLVQLFIAAVPIVVFFWLLTIDIAPTGERTTVWRVDQPSPFIDRLLPDARLLTGQKTDDKTPYTTIVEEPVYFSVHMPHTTFDQMDVALTFRNSDQPIVELGILTDVVSQAYDLRPLHNRLIDALDWDVLRNDEVFLYQREATYETIEDFYARLPERSRVATYRADLQAPYRLADYQPLGASQTFEVSLRGYHKYVTYLKDEPFDLALAWMDMNRTSGADEGVIRVRDENDKIIYEHFFADDGNVTENQVSKDGYARIVQNDLPEGVYQVELSGTSDIFWRTLTTSQRYVTFVNKIYLGDDVGYLPSPRGTAFHSNAKHLTVQTLHADAMQKLTVGSKDIVVDQAHEKLFHTVADVGVVAGYSPVGDVEIIGDGKFAFSRTAFFDPDPTTMNAYTNVDAQGIDYVLTTYQSPSAQGDWLQASGLFDLSRTAAGQDVKMIVSVPGIEYFQGLIDVQEIAITFKKEAIDGKEFIAAVLDRLPFGL